MRIQRQRGVTLLELILVIIILSLSSIPILGQFAQTARSSLIDLEFQTAAQLAQEKAEEILMTRRLHGYTHVTVGSRTEILSGNVSGYSRSVVISPTSPQCILGENCNTVRVSVYHRTSRRAEITFVLMDY